MIAKRINDQSESSFEFAEPKTPVSRIKTLKRTTTGVSFASVTSRGISNISESEYHSDEDATTQKGNVSNKGKSRSKSKNKHVPIEKDAWVKAFGEGYVLTMRRKTTYIEDINFHEFKNIPLV